MIQPAETATAPALRKMLVPLALAQFICSFAGSNMNVMINDISHDLDTTVQGVQVAITLFLLVMAALMIPGGKLTDRWGRKLLHAGTLDLCHWGCPQCPLAGTGGPDPGELDPRRGGHRSVDPARLHPHHVALQRPQVARPGVRRDQWHGRGGCGHRAIDRGLTHDGHQLAGRLRLPGRDRRDHCPSSRGGSATLSHRTPRVRSTSLVPSFPPWAWSSS